MDNNNNSSNNNVKENNPQETSFWNFLQHNTIEIPIIQRDYAQGRLGKESLRKNFLADIKKALDNKTKIKLDFVYGSVENGKLSPLDGQQRLTTLWLLHWYIALMSGNLNEDNCKILIKFTYETRISSREFCENLCKPENFKNYVSTKGNRKVVEYITSRAWFYSAWKQDPTIQSMLRMLGGTEIRDKKGVDIIDGLEEVFQNCTSEEFNKYWKLLTENAPIVFYQLPLENFGLSDDLYIEMNARGKQLTNFENFKADLVGYIREQAKDNTDWNNLLDTENGIPIKLDTNWTDIFWKNRSKDNKIDEIYFAFLNRFFLCELICQKDNNDYIFSAEKLEKEISTFKYLYGEEGNDANIKYVGWGKYGRIPSSYFNHLMCVLDNYIGNVQNFFPVIPQYNDNTITTLTQSERVVFHAFSKYLQIGKFEEESLKQWMRVVWNIVENANINSVATMIGVMRLIDELGEHSHKIYEFLASDDSSKIKSEAAKDQVAEEIAKAQQILNGEQRLDGKTWEEIIIDAEKYAFFKGAIRFLYTNGEGKVDWNDFDTKWGNAQKYFDENEEKKGNELFKNFIKQIPNFEQLKQFYYGSTKNNWRYWILLNKNLSYNVDKFLRGEEEELTYDNWTSKQKRALCDIINILEGISDDYELITNDDSILLKITGRGNGQEWKKYYIGNERNSILSQCYGGKLNEEEPNSNKIYTDNKNDKCDFFWGEHINFKYHKHFFKWYGNSDIYLMENDWTEYQQPYDYRFRVTPEIETDTSLFTKGLEKLIEEAEQSK